MKKKRSFVHGFMRVTGLTSHVLGPANRSNQGTLGKHRSPSPEELEADNFASKTWQVITTETGERYVVDVPPPDSAKVTPKT